MKYILILLSLALFSCKKEDEFKDYVSIKIDTSTPVSGFIYGRTKSGMSDIVIVYNNDSSCFKEVLVPPYEHYEFRLHNNGGMEFTAKVFCKKKSGILNQTFVSDGFYLEKNF